MLIRVQSCVSRTALSGCSGDDQVEEDWKQGDPPCICGFGMDRSAADAALRFQPVGAFLVRMCSEPGSFAISCRSSHDPHHMTGGLPGEWLSGCSCEAPAQLHRMQNSTNKNRLAINPTDANSASAAADHDEKEDVGCVVAHVLHCMAHPVMACLRSASTDCGNLSRNCAVCVPSWL